MSYDFKPGLKMLKENFEWAVKLSFFCWIIITIVVNLDVLSNTIVGNSNPWFFSFIFSFITLFGLAGATYYYFKKIRSDKR